MYLGEISRNTQRRFFFAHGVGAELGFFFGDMINVLGRTFLPVALQWDFPCLGVGLVTSKESFDSSWFHNSRILIIRTLIYSTLNSRILIIRTPK